MTEIEEAVTRVGMSLVDSQIITAYGDGRLHAKNLISDLRTILSALSASQAEIKRLTRERDEALTFVLNARRDQEAAEARATRAEAERDALWQLPELEQDEDGTITVRVFSPDNQRSQSWVFGPVNIRRIACEVGSSASYETTPYLYPTFWQAAEARATRAEALVKEAGEVLWPFAEEAAEWADSTASDAHPFVTATDNSGGVCRFNVSNLRAARAFLDKLNGEGQ